MAAPSGSWKTEFYLMNLPSHLKLAIWIDEMSLPFEEGLARAAEFGAEYVWFATIPDQPPIAELSDTQIDDMAEQVRRHGLKLFQICADHPFHNIRLCDLDAGKEMDHPKFRHDFDALVRSMQIASRLGVGAVLAYGLSWPGEWYPRHRTWRKSPTWAMRWATHGGIISECDLDGLVDIFSLLAEQAEKHDVDLVLGTRPFHFLTTTNNFRLLADRVGSRRIRAMWSPADSVMSNEVDVADSGFSRIEPCLHSLHLKDARVTDGPRGDTQWCALGEGEVDYPRMARRLIEHDRELYLAVATHFRPPGGSAVDAMRINVERIVAIVAKTVDNPTH